MTDDEISQNNNIKYVSGLSSKGERLVIVMRQDGNVWHARSTLKGVHCHDYCDSFGVVYDWLNDDVEDMCITRDRGAAQGWICDLLEEHDTFLLPDPSLSNLEAAERVLRHLEIGW